GALVDERAAAPSRATLEEDQGIGQRRGVVALEDGDEDLQGARRCAAGRGGIADLGHADVAPPRRGGEGAVDHTGGLGEGPGNRRGGPARATRTAGSGTGTAAGATGAAGI